MRKNPNAEIVIIQKSAGYRHIVTKSRNKAGEATRLSDLYAKLPHGIFDKSITGLGGTTLELDSARPSVIVEPLNITAISKAQQLSRKRKLSIFYFGTGIPDHLPLSKQLELLSLGKGLSLEQYLKNCKKESTFPKITCVSDQLSNLEQAINNTDLYKFSEFHLLLDEIDSMQEQNDFRSVMEDCVKIYKRHPRLNRTMLSATINKFHDPELKDEPWTKVSFEDFEPVPVAIHQSGFHPVRIVELVKGILVDDPEGKIVIAYNHISGIAATIKLLESNEVIAQDNIGVLCSESSKKDFEDYYCRLENGALKVQVSFMTAAYFSGLDINEKAHLIVSVDARNLTLRLSSSVLYQIQGRLRHGLLSCHLVCAFLSPRTRRVTTELVLEALEVLKPTVELFNTYNTSPNVFLRTHAEVIQNILVNGYEEMRSIWVKNKEGLSVSYLKIDSLVEDERVRYHLTTLELFKEDLKKFFTIQSEQEYEDEQLKLSTSSKEDTLGVIRSIKGFDLTNPEDKKRILAIHKELKRGPSKMVTQIALNAFNKDVFKLDSLINLIEEKITAEDKWIALLEAINYHVEFHSLFTVSKKDSFAHFVYTHFSKMDEMASESFKEHVRVSLDGLRSQVELESSEYRRFINKFSTAKFIKSIVTTVARRDKERSYKKLTSLDPFGLINTEVYQELDLDLIRSGTEVILEPAPFMLLVTEDNQVIIDPRELSKHYKDMPKYRPKRKNKSNESLE